MKLQLSKINEFLLFWVLITVVLYYGRVILIPVAFASMLAMLMAPICRKLDSKGLHRALSCTVCVLILLGIFIGVLWILAAQATGFREDLPLIEQKANQLFASLQKFIEKQFDIPADEQTRLLQQKATKFSDTAISYLTSILKQLPTLFAGLAITLAVTFLLLYHKERYETFFLRLVKGNNSPEKREILQNITQVAQRYLLGRGISMFILFVLYTISLLIIGVKDALLLSAIAAIVNIIPYIGPLLAGVFPFLVALVTEDSLQPAIWVVISFSVIQGIDNYFVTPYVLGGEVSLSALSTILIIICGGFVWGVAGMILFIPMLSIVKIVFDRVESLKPYGYLIGDPGKAPTLRFKEWLRKKFRRKR